MNVLDLFAGIGGFSLGLERTSGFRTVAFCEQDKKAQLVLKKHWPSVPIFDDVTTLTKEELDETVGLPIHVITGGFPCQDISTAGRGAGLAGERSGLWFQYHRLIEEIRPRWAIIENVSALRVRGLEVVLQGLNEIGYGAEWHCIPASAIGAPHQRDRIWIVAHVGDAICDGWNTGGQSHREHDGDKPAAANEHSGFVADCIRARLEGYARYGQEGWQAQQDGPACSQGVCRGEHPGWWWAVEPDVGRVAHGLPNRVDRLKQLGNAIVPQMATLIGDAILSAEELL